MNDVAEKDETAGAEPEGDAPMKTKACEKELLRLQAELCHLQEWVKATGQWIVAVAGSPKPPPFRLSVTPM